MGSAPAAASEVLEGPEAIAGAHHAKVLLAEKLSRAMVVQ